MKQVKEFFDEHVFDSLPFKKIVIVFVPDSTYLSLERWDVSNKFQERFWWIL